MNRSSPSTDDELVFLDEAAADMPELVARKGVWRILIVDDDTDVHSATMFALSNLEMQRRPLEFLHAYSAVEARQLLVEEKDIAVILLDVVMEQGESGLQLVRHIREVLKLTEVRIILRTGQPGYAPADRCDSRFRHQRLQDQVRADPHQVCTPPSPRRSVPTNRSAQSMPAGAASTVSCAPAPN